MAARMPTHICLLFACFDKSWRQEYKASWLHSELKAAQGNPDTLYQNPLVWPRRSCTRRWWSCRRARARASSTPLCRTGTRATRRASAASTTSSPSAACATALPRTSPGRRRASTTYPIPRPKSNHKDRDVTARASRRARLRSACKITWKLIITSSALWQLCHQAQPEPRRRLAHLLDAGAPKHNTDVNARALRWLTSVCKLSASWSFHHRLAAA